jgi:crotonobetainyl-CoA:carnitine CoA-transferase CaiB-like acyl-CoA transferase
MESTDVDMPTQTVQVEALRSNKGIPSDALPLKRPAAGFDLLTGVRVVDLTTSIAGPSGTMLLADMGAEVIKIERPAGGDDARSWGPPFLEGQSLWFASVNRNKKSVALDYSLPAGLDLLYRLIREADVVMVNLPPRVAQKLKVCPEALRAVRPDLIYVSITGFGLAGPRADWTCYDLIAEGYSGIMDITGAAGGDPQKIGAPAADMLAGQDAAFAAVAALYARKVTGKGRVIDVALVDSMTRFLTCRIASYLGSGELPTRSGGPDSVIAIYQTFATADEPMTLALGNDNLWQRFWAAVGDPAYAESDEFRTNADRRRNRAQIVSRIASILREKPRSHWLAVLREARIPAGPINDLSQVIADEAMLARGMFYRVALENGGSMPQVGTGIVVDGECASLRSPPAALGENTDDILERLLGLTEHERHTLEQERIIRRRNA